MKSSDFWQHKCVIITGASSGIGQALAEHVAARGAKVGLLARRQSALERVVATIRAANGQAACGAADVANNDALLAAIRQLESQFGPCDVLIANAGIYRKTSGRSLHRQHDGDSAVHVAGIKLPFTRSEWWINWYRNRCPNWNGIRIE